MIVKDIEAKTKTISETTGRRAGNVFYVVWNTFMDIIYLISIVTVVSIGIYVAYTNGVDHPAIIWSGEKVNHIWLNICQYFKLA